MKDNRRVEAIQWASAMLSQSKDPYGMKSETKTNTHGASGFQDLLDNEVAKRNKQDKETQE